MRGMLSVLRTRTGRQIKRPVPIPADLNCEVDGRCYADHSSGEGIGVLTRCRLIVSMDGIRIEGLELAAEGALRYQEWWFAVRTHEEATHAETH